MYKNIIIGNINATSYWDDEENGVRARLSVDRENFKTISADGYYYPDKNSSFDIDLTFDQADFKMLEVVTEGNLSNLKGQADGSLNISGTADKPVVKGDCEISNGAFLVDYLQTRYDFGGKISFEKDKIDLTM